MMFYSFKLSWAALGSGNFLSTFFRTPFLSRLRTRLYAFFSSCVSVFEVRSHFRSCQPSGFMTFKARNVCSEFQRHLVTRFWRYAIFPMSRDFCRVRFQDWKFMKEIKFLSRVKVLKFFFQFKSPGMGLHVLNIILEFFDSHRVRSCGHPREFALTIHVIIHLRVSTVPYLITKRRTAPKPRS